MLIETTFVSQVDPPPVKHFVTTSDEFGTERGGHPAVLVLSVPWRYVFFVGDRQLWLINYLRLPRLRIWRWRSASRHRKGD